MIAEENFLKAPKAIYMEKLSFVFLSNIFDFVFVLFCNDVHNYLIHNAFNKPGLNRVSAVLNTHLMQ